MTGQDAWPPVSVVDRFWSRTNKTDDGCWPWTGADDSHGYGVIALYAKRGELRRYVHFKVHRISWAIKHGALPRGNLVHTGLCANRRCVNPDHWRVACERLTPIQAAEIRSELALGNGETHGEIAARHGVDRTTICKIARGKIWRAAAAEKAANK